MGVKEIRQLCFDAVACDRRHFDPMDGGKPDAAFYVIEVVVPEIPKN